jgi:hypothetical protein
VAASTLKWLLTLTLPDGRIFRASTQQADVTGKNYDTILVSEPVYQEELDLFSLDSTASFQQASLAILTNEDLADMAADWRHITAATGELAVLFDDDAYEDRRVLLSGARLQNLQVGLAGEETAFVLEGVGAPEGASVGLDSQDMGDEWPDTLQDTDAADMSSVVGRKRVYVFGDPNRVPAYKVGAVSSSNRLILCGHWLPDTGSVNAYEDSRSASNVTPSNTSNSVGEYAHTDSVSAYKAANGGYTWDASRGGIASATDLTAPALRASGVLRKLLTMSGETIDWRSMQDTLNRLHRYQCGFWTDSEVGALALIRQRMVPVFPIVEVMGPDGLYFALSDPHVREPEISLVEGQQLIGRIGRLTFSDADAVKNQFTINYDYNATTGAYQGSVTIDKDNDALCHLSHQLQGRVIADNALKTAAISDEATAYAVLRARAARLALQRRQVSFLGALDLIEQLRAGMVVLLTSATWGMNSQKAVLKSIQYTRAGLLLDFDLIDRTPNSRR